MKTDNQRGVLCKSVIFLLFFLRVSLQNFYQEASNQEMEMKKQTLKLQKEREKMDKEFQDREKDLKEKELDFARKGKELGDIYFERYFFFFTQHFMRDKNGLLSNTHKMEVRLSGGITKRRLNARISF